MSPPNRSIWQTVSGKSLRPQGAVSHEMHRSVGAFTAPQLRSCEPSDPLGASAKALPNVFCRVARRDELAAATS